MREAEQRRRMAGLARRSAWASTCDVPSISRAGIAPCCSTPATTARHAELQIAVDLPHLFTTATQQENASRADQERPPTRMTAAAAAVRPRVAMATILPLLWQQFSRSTQTLWEPIGQVTYEVLVNVAIKRDAALPYQYADILYIGDFVTRSIAWPAR